MGVGGVDKEVEEEEEEAAKGAVSGGMLVGNSADMFRPDSGAMVTERRETP